jgi:tetratricopeptide (TPR) repeat protein
MYSFLCALAAATAAFFAVAIPTRGSYAILPALIVFGATYFLLARRHSKAIEALMQRMTREMEQQRTDNAIRVLHEGYAHARWVFLMRGQLDGQIGSLHFMKKDFDAAQPLLERAWGRHWVAKGMLAAFWFRKHKPEEAFTVLDKAIAMNKKEPMLYGLKAYLKAKLKDRDGARDALMQGKDVLPKNEAITANLVRLQNGQDLQMWQFGDAWWNFHLEKPSQKMLMKMAGQAGVGSAKGGKKAMYRG